jgi:hypothetical protein
MSPYFSKGSAYLLLLLLLTPAIYTPFSYATSDSSASSTASTSLPISFPELAKVEPSLRKMLDKIGLSDSDFVKVIVKIKSSSVDRAVSYFGEVPGVRVLGSTEVLPFVALSVNAEGLRRIVASPIVEAVYPVYNVSICMIPPQDRKIGYRKCEPTQPTSSQTKSIRSSAHIQRI